MSKVDTSGVTEMLKKISEQADAKIINTLSFLGDQCVTEARDRSYEQSWCDQTGNLRSSIGFAISRGGEVVKTSTFDQVKQGSKGKEDGKAFAEKVASASVADYSLILVAGMDYAAYVEAMENKVVLASAETLAREKLPLYIEKLKNQITSLDK